MRERRYGVNPLPVDDELAKAGCSDSPRASSSDCASAPQEVLSEFIEVSQRFGLSPFALARPSELSQP
jgi:hypothetical protein